MAQFLVSMQRLDPLVISYTMNPSWVCECQFEPPGGEFMYRLHHRAAATIPEQLAAIFETSLRRLNR